MKRVVLLTNEMTPYRKSFYDKLYESFKSMGIDFKVLTMTRLQKGYNWNFDEVMAPYVHLMKGIHISSVVSMHLNFEVSSQLRTLRPDILIMAGSYMNPTSWLAMRSLKNSKCKTFFWSESHLNEVRDYNSLILKAREYIRNKFYKKFDGFWFAGKLSKEFIGKYASKDAIMQFVPNLIDNTTYYTKSTELRQNIITLRDKWGVSVNKKVAIIPARLSKVKGILEFIDLLTKSKYRDSLTILISGTGPLRDEIQEQIEKSGLDIRLLGYQQQDNVIELYSLSDLFVMPSLSDPNPLTCIEALWCRLPLLVSSHVGNYPEVISEGVNGYVFEYSDEDKAIEKIDKILSASTEWYSKASEKSLEIATNHYNSQSVARELITNLYDYLV